MSVFITQYCRISNNSIHVGGQNIYNIAEKSFLLFAEGAYRHLNLHYSKFHKMDNLSKLGFLGADILLNNNVLSKKYDPYDIGIILSNKNSSLDTDLKHNRQVQSGHASPSVFVYSLPNIVIGEICIRHGIKGENTFFIENEYNIPNQVQYITYLFRSNSLNACIGGWVELLGDQYDCFLYLAENTISENKIPFNSDQIRKLYTRSNE